MPARADILLRGGTVIDGLGGAPFVADVAIRGGSIAAIGDCGTDAGETIDVAGEVVAPGFVDAHAHDDLACIARPDMTAKLTQGITTVVVGNCGISPAGLRFAEGSVREPFNLLGSPPEFRHADFASYAAAIDAARPAVNVAALVGHSALRVACMADLTRPADAGELTAMRALLRDALDGGAAGLSSGMFYAPAQAATADEVGALARDLAAAGGVYATHLRDEYDGIADALAEAFATVANGGPPLVLSHHKCAGVRNWGRSTETLGLIDAARAGHEVALDCYPYDAGSTVIRPDLADGQTDILINWSAPCPDMAGRLLADIAAEWACDQRTAAERLSPGGASYFQISESDVRAILSHPACMIGTDGLPCDPMPHPRLWGAFPRVFGRYVRELGLVTLEAAVARATALPARLFGLSDRGRIAVGMAADVTVFDSATILDRATYAAPTLAAEGIRHVIVGGGIALRDGTPTGARDGRFLRRHPSSGRGSASGGRSDGSTVR